MILWNVDTYSKGQPQVTKTFQECDDPAFHHGPTYHHGFLLRESNDRRYIRGSPVTPQSLGQRLGRILIISYQRLPLLGSAKALSRDDDEEDHYFLTVPSIQEVRRLYVKSLTPRFMPRRCFTARWNSKSWTQNLYRSTLPTKLFRHTYEIKVYTVPYSVYSLQSDVWRKHVNTWTTAVHTHNAKYWRIFCTAYRVPSRPQDGNWYLSIYYARRP